MKSIDTIIKLALNEVGYLEKKDNTNLKNKIKNAGLNSYTKYSQELDNIQNFYRSSTNGKKYWCIQFIDWLFVKSFGVKNTKEIIFQDPIGEDATYIALLYQLNNRWYNQPKIGDLIFLNHEPNGHMGIVVFIKNNYLYMVDGNSYLSSTHDKVGVKITKYQLNDSKIAGYGRPFYEKIENTCNFSIINNDCASFKSTINEIDN